MILAFFFLLFLTPIYLWKVSGVTNKIQLLVSTFSYVIWVYTLVYPFKYWKWYYPTIGAVILVLWSLVIPFFVKPTEEMKAKSSMKDAEPENNAPIPIEP